jgi:hypothetical protein
MLASMSWIRLEICSLVSFGESILGYFCFIRVCSPTLMASDGLKSPRP